MPDSRVKKLAVVFAISALLMCLEFVEIRIIGISHWFHLTYFTITLALLGFAVGGTVLSVNRTVREARWERLTAVSLFGFGVFALAAMWYGATVVGNTFTLIDEIRGGNYRTVLGIYVPLMFLLAMPFFFASLIVCRTLMDMGRRGNEAYAFNLIGTAFGVGVFILLLRPMGGYALCFGLVAMSAAIGLIVSPKGHWLRFALSMLLAVSAIGVFRPEAFFTPRMDASKHIASYNPDSVFETVWTPMFRVDFIRQSYGATITADGDAQTWMFRLDLSQLSAGSLSTSDEGQISRHIVFRMIPEGGRHAALVIGAGGGMDVLAARQAGGGNFGSVFHIDRYGIYVDTDVPYPEDGADTGPSGYIDGSRDSHTAIFHGTVERHEFVRSFQKQIIPAEFHVIARSRAERI